jgi:hypothetical protein
MNEFEWFVGAAILGRIKADVAESNASFPSISYG